MRHSVPNGNPAEIVSSALRRLLEHVKRQKMAAVKRPRARRARSAGKAGNSHTRRITSDVKRAVWVRDDGRCAFVGLDGRCEARQFIEVHHVKPFAAGGSGDEDNIELRCRAHNGYEAEVFFGPST